MINSKNNSSTNTMSVNKKHCYSHHDVGSNNDNNDNTKRCEDAKKETNPYMLQTLKERKEFLLRMSYAPVIICFIAFGSAAIYRFFQNGFRRSTSNYNDNIIVVVDVIVSKSDHEMQEIRMVCFR